MSLADKVVGIGELSAALGRSEAWIKRKWLELHMLEGMPRKIATGWIWPRGAMERWIEEQGMFATEVSVSHVTPADPAMANVISIEKSALRERYSRSVAR